MTNTTNFAYNFMGSYKFGGNIGETEMTVCKVTYDSKNSLYTVSRNEIESFNDWVAYTFLSETDAYDDYLDGKLDHSELFDAEALSVEDLF